MGTRRQSALRFIAAGCLTQLGCSGEAFVELPDVVQAKAWVVLYDSERATIFDSGPAAHVPLEEGAKLIALPLSTSDLGVVQGEFRLSPGRPVSVLASFSYADGVFIEDAAVAFELPLDLDDCEVGCLKVVACSECSVKATQVCGSCTEPPGITPPTPPSSQCPEGWNFASQPKGHESCSMPRPSGIEQPCPAGRRWSMRSRNCIEVEACRAPTLNPMATTYYVDPAAPAGGDGSLANPFSTVPGNLSSATVVLLPGVHPGPVVAAGNDLTIVGHGVCSVIRASASQDALSLMGSGAVVSDVLLEAADLGRALVVGAQTASVSRAHLQAGEAVVAAQGLLLLSDSLVESRVACTAECDRRPTVLAELGVRISNSDILASAALQTASGPLSVKDSRLLSNGGPGIAVAADTPTDIEFENIAVLGFGMGVRIPEVGPAGGHFSDVLLTTRNLPPKTGVGIRLTGVAGGEVVDMQRIELETVNTALAYRDLGGELTDIRVQAGYSALQVVAETASNNFTVRRVWLDFAGVGINAKDVFLTVSDAWLSRSRPWVGQESVGGIFGSEFLFVGDRINILANGGPGITGFDSVEISDLRIRESRVTGVARERTLRPPTLMGQRWDIEGSDTGLSLAGSFELTDLRVAPDPNGTGFTPICALRNSTGFARGFTLARTGNRATIAVLDPDLRTLPVQDLRFESGRLMPEDIARATTDCVQNAPGLTQYPLFDDVIQR